jgi:hypothetical protein
MYYYIIISKLFNLLTHIYNINYFFRQSLIINRHKIKDILSTIFNSSLLDLNKQFEVNIQSFGAFSLTFDIWTSNNGTSYYGLIIIWIDIHFKLNYKLIG